MAISLVNSRGQILHAVRAPMLAHAAHLISVDSVRHASVIEKLTVDPSYRPPIYLRIWRSNLEKPVPLISTKEVFELRSSSNCRPDIPNGEERSRDAPSASTGDLGVQTLTLSWKMRAVAGTLEEGVFTESDGEQRENRQQP